MTAGPFGGCPSSRPRATFDFPRIESTYVEYKRSLQGVGTKKIRWSDSGGIVVLLPVLSKRISAVYGEQRADHHG